MLVDNKKPIIKVAVQPKPKLIKLNGNDRKKITSKGGDPKKVAKSLDNISRSKKQLQSKFSELAVLAPVLDVGLTTKGIVPPKDLAIKAEKFYNDVVLQAHNTPISKYSSVMKPTDIVSTSSDNFDTAKDAIVTGITAFIKNIKSKAEAGGSLSKVEENVLNATETVEANVKKAAKQEASQQLGENILFNPKVRLYGGIAVAVLVLIFILKK